MEIEKEVAEFVDTIKKDPFKYYFQNKENEKVKWEEDYLSSTDRSEKVENIHLFKKINRKIIENRFP